MGTEIDTLVAHIRNETGHASAINPDDDWLAADILDSFSIVTLSMFAQEQFGVEWEAEDVACENLASMSSLVALIRRCAAA